MYDGNKIKKESNNKKEKKSKDLSFVFNEIFFQKKCGVLGIDCYVMT